MTGQTSKTRLQRERLKHQWTQAEIAEKVGVDPKTFGRWERGEQVANPTMRRVLSELLGEEVDRSWFLGSDETEESSEALWHVPYGRNPYFVDHNQRVEYLHTLLTSDGKETPHGAISGLGGIGKTQLAFEYAHHYRDFYQVVLWARAGTQAQLFEDFASIAHILQLSETRKSGEKQQYLVNKVLYWLQSHYGWLLILDNVEEDLDNEDFSIVRLLSVAKSGHILLTTRIQSVANLAQNLVLDSLSPEEGAQFLLWRSHHFPLFDALQVKGDAQYENALVLARLLDGLPLALEQAAAYIQETGCGLAGYKQVYETSRKDVLHAQVTYKRLYTDYAESVATTWLISFRRVEQQSIVASELLKLFAYLAPDAIPVSMILKGAEKLDANLHVLAGNAYLLNSACQILLKYSLIKRFAEGAMLSVHRLIQVVLQDSMEVDTQPMWAERAVRMVEHCLASAPAEDFDQYLPHARLCATFIKEWALQGQEAAHLLEMIAKAVYQQGWRAQARPLYLRAYEAAISLLGEKDPHVLSLRVDIARVHMDLGADALAVLLYRSAIEELEEQFGKESPEVIHCLNCLAEAQIRMGALHKAEQTCSDVLSRYTEGAVPDASQQAISYSLAARIAEWLNKLDSAEAYYQTALYISTQTFGDAHPEVAKRAADLGVFCVIHHRDLAQAERLLRQALEIRQQALGREHPEMAESLVYLAMLCWEQKQHHEAEEYYQQALAIRRQKLGPYHPGVLQILHDLAELATEQYKDEEAEQYFREMLSLAPHAGCTKSYEYLMLLKAFVDFLRTRGRMEEALHYQEQITTLARQLATRRPLYSLDLSSAIGEGEEGLSGPWVLMS